VATSSKASKHSATSGSSLVPRRTVKSPRARARSASRSRRRSGLAPVGSPAVATVAVAVAARPRAAAAERVARGRRVHRPLEGVAGRGRRGGAPWPRASRRRHGGRCCRCRAPRRGRRPGSRRGRRRGHANARGERRDRAVGAVAGGHGRILSAKGARRIRRASPSPPASRARQRPPRPDGTAPRTPRRREAPGAGSRMFPYRARQDRCHHPAAPDRLALGRAPARRAAAPWAPAARAPPRRAPAR
jgi:hypothetical protein